MCQLCCWDVFVEQWCVIIVTMCELCCWDLVISGRGISVHQLPCGYVVLIRRSFDFMHDMQCWMHNIVSRGNIRHELRKSV